MAENAGNIPYPPHFCIQFYSQFNIPPSASPFPNIPDLGTYLFYFARLQFISFFNESIAFIISVLLSFLQLKYQGNGDQSKSPFTTHPTTMYVAVSSSVVYYLADVKRRRLSGAAYHCWILSGYIAVASLASVLLPDSFSPFICAVFGLLSASELLYWLYRKLVAEFEVRRWWICRFLNKVWRAVGNSYGQQMLLPI